jgi:hypothetical protein
MAQTVFEVQLTLAAPMLFEALAVPIVFEVHLLSAAPTLAFEVQLLLEATWSEDLVPHCHPPFQVVQTP